MVIITLRFLASGKMQQCNSDDMGVSQSTVSTVIAQTLDALSSIDILRRFITFPHTMDAVERKKAEFLHIAQFSGVIGVTDCTHIRNVAPKQEEAAYINRKRYHSINVQIAFDENYKTAEVLAKCPGSVHDARIFSDNAIRPLFERNIIPAGCHLLGDRRYSSQQYLLTP
ncbi:putative nuclease HARBI1 [Scylla paramamosain]|uniref:putative nuclease HARBI1 n=1 Tax=Scylla paramamosain TaxID=85552 RepID=UPI003082ED99